MTHEHTVHSLAVQLQDAQDHGRQISPFSQQHPGFGIDAAYEVADLIHQARLAQGARAGGRKIGFTNSAMWATYGVDQPVWSHMYAHTITHLDSGLGSCALAGLAEPKIEPEIALHFHREPPAAASNDLAVLMDCIDWIAPAFEIVQSHYPGWKFAVADTIADGGLHGSLFVGAPVSLSSLGDNATGTMARCSVTLSCDGAVREIGCGANALGNPLSAMAHLLAVLRRQPIQRPIQAGEIITTGTLTAAWPVKAGEKWEMCFEGIGLQALRLQFSA